MADISEYHNQQFEVKIVFFVNHSFLEISSILEVNYLYFNCLSYSIMPDISEKNSTFQWCICKIRRERKIPKEYTCRREKVGCNWWGHWMDGHSASTFMAVVTVILVDWLNEWRNNLIVLQVKIKKHLYFPEPLKYRPTYEPPCLPQI